MRAEGDRPFPAAYAAAAGVEASAHCTGCGACIPACPQRALSLDSEHPAGWGRKRAVAAARGCTACGACLPACPRQALHHAAGRVR